MPDANLKSQENAQLAETAIRCFMGTLLAAADCMAETCPEIGMTFKRRWARAPQRLNFRVTNEGIEETFRMFEKDLKAYAGFASQYFRPAVPLVTGITGKGAAFTDALLDRIAGHSVMLDTLAESIAVTADLDAPPPVREALEHQSAGLLNCARKMENELLPLIADLREIFRECEEVVTLAKGILLVDPDTGLFNLDGFQREIVRRRNDESLQCVVRLRVNVVNPDGNDCSDAEFGQIATVMAGAVYEQFRASESIGLVGREFRILFAGTTAQANGRHDEIVRRLSGKYPINGRTMLVAVKMDVSEPGEADWAREWTGAPMQAVQAVS